MKRIFALSICAGLLLCACVQPPTRPSLEDTTPTWQEQYDLGVRYLSEGNYEEAIIAFTAAIEIDPKRAEAYEKLADTYVALGDTESAVEILRQGAETIGDDTLFRSRIDELTAGAEQSPGSMSEPWVKREDYSNGSYVLSYYDAAGILMRVEHYNPDGILDIYWLNYYDAEGNQTQQEQYDPDGTLRYTHYYDEEGNVTHTEYN